jgi:hypothetical protein
MLPADRLPNAAALNAVQKLIECGVAENKIQTQYQLIGHRQNTASQTECPGNRLFQEITSWPHWTPDPKSSSGVQNTHSDQPPRLEPEDHKGLGQSAPGGKASTSSANLFLWCVLTAMVILKQRI